MTKKQRKQVFDKFGGLCAYSGLPLCDDWQIDHAKSKFLFENSEQRKMEETKDWKDFNAFIDRNRNIPEMNTDVQNMKYCIYILREEAQYNAKEQYGNIENLLPALSIVNHYKREKDINGFREYLLGLHARINGLYYKIKGYEHIIKRGQKKRLEYLLKVADCFGITRQKQFSGIFYFEALLKGSE